MKIIVALVATTNLLVTVETAVVKASNILSRTQNSSKPVEHASPRKLSLFTRTQAVKKDQQPLFGLLPGTQGAQGLPASSLAGTGLNAPGQYVNGNQDAARLAALYGNKGDCHPKCWWTCGNANCDEVCDPVCAPPQCETACAPIALASCRQKCEPPKCAIVCPTNSCTHGGCPGCKTVCAPPQCTTQCAEQCQSKCADPECTWKCNPGQCEKPQCSLQCGGAKECGLDSNVNARPPPFPTGMTVLARNLASNDPTSLQSGQPGYAPQMQPVVPLQAQRAPPPSPSAIVAASPVAAPPMGGPTPIR